MPATSVGGAFFSACSWAWPNSVAAKANGAIEHRPRIVMEIILSLNGNYHVRRFRRRAAEVILAAGVNLRWGGLPVCAHRKRTQPGMRKARTAAAAAVPRQCGCATVAPGQSL